MHNMRTWSVQSEWNEKPDQQSYLPSWMHG